MGKIHWGEGVKQTIISSLAIKDKEKTKEMLQALDEVEISTFLSLVPSAVSTIDVVEFCNSSLYCENYCH